MKLIKVTRQFSLAETWINIDKINVIVKTNDYERNYWSVVMDNGITYDINDESKRELTNEQNG